MNSIRTPWREHLRHDEEHFEDLLPEDAILMSSVGRAEGFDDMRFGLKRAIEGSNPQYPVARINSKGIQYLVKSDKEKEWLGEVAYNSREWKSRLSVVRAQNFTTWDNLTPSNRDYLLSLLWIPVQPYSAMEIIARMANQ